MENKFTPSPLRLLRLSDIIIGNPKADPPIPPRIPVAKSTFLGWVQKGIAPKPIKLGRCALWKEDELQAWITEAEEKGGSHA